MKSRLEKKLSKRFVTASIGCGRQGLINIHGIKNHDGTFMKRHSCWSVNEWCETPSNSEISKVIKRCIR